MGKLAPEYEEAAKAFDGESSVGIYTVDATENGELANKYDVSGYPTLKWFPPGASEPEDYQSGRDAEALIDFENDKAWLARTKGGGMAPAGGLISDLDDMVEGASAYDAGLVDSLKAAVENYTGVEATKGARYVAVATKVADKGVEYVKNEIAASLRWSLIHPFRRTRRPISCINSMFCAFSINKHFYFFLSKQIFCSKK